MATLTVQVVAEAGLAPSYAAAAGGGDEIPNDNGDVILHVKNGGGGSINVTVAPQVASVALNGGLGTYTRSNLVVAVPNGGERMIGPFPRRAFNNANGRVAVTYSGVTSVTVAAIRVPVKN